MSAPARSTAEPTAPNGWPRSLLAGFRDGDTDALSAVYRMHSREVATLLRHGFTFRAQTGTHRFVGYASGFELQDALHETFRRAFEPRARQGYDGIRPYGPYLRTIARNVVLRSFRSKEVQFPATEDDAPGPIELLADAEAEGPEHSLAAQQVRAVVQRFLDGLPEQDREILTLRFAQSQSQRDVAAALGLGRQQIRSREARLRKRLLEHLRAQGEADLVPSSALAVALLQGLTAALEGWP